jgi:hypothetical protein
MRGGHAAGPRVSKLANDNAPWAVGCASGAQINAAGPGTGQPGPPA